MNPENRDLIRVAIQMVILLCVALVAVKLAWPPEKHPLMIDARSIGEPSKHLGSRAARCPSSTPAPKSFMPAPPPLSDTRRIA